MNCLCLGLNNIRLSGSITLQTGPKLLSNDLQSRINWNKISSTSSQISWMDVYIRHLGVMCRVLREVQVVRPGPIVRGPEISLYSTRVLSYGQYRLYLCRLATVRSGPKISGLD